MWMVSTLTNVCVQEGTLAQIVKQVCTDVHVSPIETRRYEFESRSRQRIFRCSLPSIRIESFGMINVRGVSTK